MGLLIDALVYAGVAWLLTRRFMLGWLTPEEKCQRVKLTSPIWLAPRLGISLAAGVVVTLGSAWLYALGPNASLSAATRTAGFSQLEDGLVWSVQRRRGTGVLLIESFAFRPEEYGLTPRQMKRFEERPPADSVADAWSMVALPPPYATDEPEPNRWILGFGWPRPALWLAHEIESKGPLDPGVRFFRDTHFGGLELGDGFGKTELPNSLPVRPALPGLGLNITLYSGLVFCGFLGAAVGRIVVRRHNGQCPVCGLLPEDSAKGCSSCGWRWKDPEPEDDLSDVWG